MLWACFGRGITLLRLTTKKVGWSSKKQTSGTPIRPSMLQPEIEHHPFKERRVILETNSEWKHLTMDGWKMNFLLGFCLFSGAMFVLGGYSKWPSFLSSSRYFGGVHIHLRFTINNSGKHLWTEKALCFRKRSWENMYHVYPPWN